MQWPFGAQKETGVAVAFISNGQAVWPGSNAI